MSYVKALFSQNGQVSMMRLMSLTCVIAAVVIALIGLSKPQIDYSGLSMLCSAFLGAAFGGKIMQKKTEVSQAS